MGEYPAEARYDKLVRDRIPEIIKADGLSVEIRTLESDELVSILKAKAVEEAKELETSEEIEDIKKEMADLIEVIISLGDKLQIDMDEVEQIRQDRRTKRGGFDNGVFLERTYEDKK